MLTFKVKLFKGTPMCIEDSDHLNFFQQSITILRENTR